MTEQPETPRPSLPAAEEGPEPKAEVGVGPWEGELPQGGHWDPDLLADGDRRNVVDKYRYWKHEAIVADLDSKRHNFHIAIENWQHDLNIGTVVRTANAFLRQGSPHHRTTPVEPPRGHGHRPLPARPPPPHR